MRRHVRTFLYCSIIVTCAIFAFSFGAYSDIYKWVDEKSVVHYTDSPPPGKEAEKLQERPVDKVGGTEPISPKAGEGQSDSYFNDQMSDLEERIKYYETQINNCEGEIEDYQEQIKKLEKKIWDLPGHSSSQSEANHYDRLKKSYESNIERYKSRIEDKQNQIYEYGTAINNLKNQLHELRLEEISTPKEQIPMNAIIYRGDVARRVFHQRGCKNYNCENCTVVFHSRGAAIGAGYRPCEVCNP
jgi:chaperonin cofactor prefoldin